MSSETQRTLLLVEDEIILGVCCEIGKSCTNFIGIKNDGG